LLSELGDSDYAKSIFDIVEALSEDIKADAELYKERLKLCKSCDNLFSGMCKHCGCFVELRAAKKAQYCPDIYPKW
jgi:Rieske Fe-S protein